MTQQHRNNRLFEGLRANDLEDMVLPIFTVDQFKSKMGNDEDVIVIAFKVKEKMPAIDLMEFIEKGYQAVLDADTSTGEERDGRYSVFVEFERNDSAPKYIMDMVEGIGKLCNCDEWSFRYYKNPELYDASEDALSEHIPLNKEEYEEKIMSLKQDTVSDFFDQGAIDNVEYDQEDNLNISKPFAETLNLKLIALGHYDDIKDQIKGGIQLDESSRNQTVYLEKYLGNYEIYKIDNKFLIKNGDRALIVSKDRW